MGSLFYRCSILLGFIMSKKTREVAFWTFIRRQNHKPLQFFDIIKPRRIEHLQNQEPFSSDPYSRTILMFEIKIAQYFRSFFVPQLETLWPTLSYWVAVQCACGGNLLDKVIVAVSQDTKWPVKCSERWGKLTFFFLNCPKTAPDICKASLLCTGENLLSKMVCKNYEKRKRKSL